MADEREPGLTTVARCFEVGELVDAVSRASNRIAVTLSHSETFRPSDPDAWRSSVRATGERADGFDS